MSSRVSVIIPTFNRAKEIVKTLTDLRKQTFTDFDIFVIDNSSKDNTKEIIDSKKTFGQTSLIIM